MNKINKNKIETETPEPEDNYIICHFALEWIITLFTRFFEDFNNIYRIFDYLMVSHSLAIYFLCAEIIIDYYYKLKDKNILEDRAGQQAYYKSLNFDEINFDLYIEKCEKNLNKYLNDSKFKKMYSNLNLNRFYPIINSQAFVEKWVMVNNKKEYKSSFTNYIKGPWSIFKSFLVGEDDFIKKENVSNNNKEIKEDKKNK